MKKKRVVQSIMLLGFVCFCFLLVQSHSLISEAAVADISTDKYAPTGDASISYPQISIRTNRTPQRTDINMIANQADDIANKFPKEDSKDRSEAVIDYLNHQFGGGGFGHTWIIIFHSAKPDDYTSYAYHEQYGFVKNDIVDGKPISSLNDHSSRRFSESKTIPLPAGVDENSLESSIIPQLNQISETFGQAMGIPYEKGDGAYTPISNCTWFAGQLWNYATKEKMIFTQSFNGATHATNWGMPFLQNVSEISDPGMFSESLSQEKICDTDGREVDPTSHYKIKINVNDGSSIAGIPYYFNEKSYEFYKWTYLTTDANTASSYSLSCSEPNEGIGYKIHDDATNGNLVRQSSTTFYPRGGIYTKKSDLKGDLFTFTKAGYGSSPTYKMELNTGGITADPENTGAIITNGNGHTFNVSFEKIN